MSIRAYIVAYTSLVKCYDMRMTNTNRNNEEGDFTDLKLNWRHIYLYFTEMNREWKKNRK